MPNRYCVCGKYIYHTKTLCEDCQRKYGTDRSAWEPWLQEWVKCMDRECKTNSRHRHLPIFEETETGEDSPIYSEAIGNLNAAMRYPELDFEDFIWGNV